MVRNGWICHSGWRGLVRSQVRKALRNLEVARDGGRESGPTGRAL
ncbi:MAG: hypothetical protein QXQ53_01410 [Candidatus Methanosuratincola sp.]